MANAGVWPKGNGCWRIQPICLRRLWTALCRPGKPCVCSSPAHKPQCRLALPPPSKVFEPFGGLKTAIDAVVRGLGPEEVVRMNVGREGGRKCVAEDGVCGFAVSRRARTSCSG